MKLWNYLALLQTYSDESFEQTGKTAMNGDGLYIARWSPLYVGTELIIR